MEPTKIIETLSQVFRPAHQLIPGVLQHQYDFAIIGFGPTEHTTDDEPPKRLGPRQEIIPIDEYLGLYEPDSRKITLFNLGIRDAAERLVCNPEHLKRIVNLHEYAHALVHLGLTADQRHQILKNPQESAIFPACTALFQSIENGLHENLAQLLTLHTLQKSAGDATIPEAKDTLAKMLDIFHALARRQPNEYRIDEYLDVPLSRIQKGFDLLKRQLLIGKIEPWKTVLTW
jgi:hypothetical protein